MQVTIINHFADSEMAKFSGGALEIETKLRYAYGLLLKHIPSGDLGSILDELGRTWGLDVSVSGYDHPPRARKELPEAVDPRSGDVEVFNYRPQS